MGERAASVNHAGSETGNSAGSPREASRHLASEISALRQELGEMVAELDRRRHELTDVRLQAKRHAGVLALVAGALLAAGMGFVWLTMARRARHRRLLTPTVWLRHAMGRALSVPAPVAMRSTVTEKIVMAGAAALASTLAKRGVEQVLDAWLDSSTRTAPKTGRDRALVPNARPVPALVPKELERP
jgi:hypothetical protein